MQVEQGGLAYTVFHPDEFRRRLAHNERFSIVDARSDGTYRNSGQTVAGAIRIAPEDLNRRKNEIPKGQTLVLVADVDVAESMALALLADGYTDVYLIEGGFDAYARAGGKTEPARV
ncbi:rhodanese-like domain-containing protein [Vulgatibacter sp.]|uniref:rhodanese-like domain-containing protein n=1 Tax=Vulgatibacter sp. TaxID=1971226 RepID=UPI003565F85D